MSVDLAVATPDALLARLDPRTDLRGVVARVGQHDLRRLVVTEEAVVAWQARDPTGWHMVSLWLTARRVVVLVVPAGHSSPPGVSSPGPPTRSVTLRW